MKEDPGCDTGAHKVIDDDQGPRYRTRHPTKPAALVTP